MRLTTEDTEDTEDRRKNPVDSHRSTLPSTTLRAVEGQD